MTKYLIIDDEYIAHDIIKGYCDMLPEMELAKQCYDAIEALEYLRDHSVDLIFLDLNMPKLKGFEFLKTLSRTPKVIVTTAYQEYALEGYELNVSDYLLKPFSFERFLKAVNTAMQNQSNSYLNSSEKADTSSSIFLYSDKKYIQVFVNDILYVEAAGNYVKVVMTTQVIMIRDKISQLLAKLKSNQFVQVHKSFAVAKHHISSIEGNQIKILDSLVPIGKTYRDSIKRLVRS